MDPAEHDHLVHLAQALSEWDLLNDHPEGSLRKLAYDKIIQEFIDLGTSYDSMRLVGDETMAREHLLVVTSDGHLYTLSRRLNSQMFTDFPHYDNDVVLLPINPHGHQSQYYRIDRSVKDPRYPDPEQYVFAGIEPGGYVGGRVMQPIQLIRSNGAVSSRPQFVSFVVGHD